LIELRYFAPLGTALEPGIGLGLAVGPVAQPAKRCAINARHDRVGLGRVLPDTPAAERSSSVMSSVFTLGFQI
jgi:hypothetical protein